MTEKEMMKISVEEFARVQKYMLLIDNKDSAVYKEIRGRYIASGINLAELDVIKE